MFHLASRNASLLPHEIDDLRFGFYGRILSGAQQQRPRERRALAATSGALGDAVGRIYVARYFPADGPRRRAAHGAEHHQRLRPASLQPSPG